MAVSNALRAIAPTVSSDGVIGSTPRLLTEPYVGRSAVTPLSAAGIRTEPPVSVPSAARHRSAPSAAPEPPLEPPGMRAASQALAQVPKWGLSLVAPKASSCMLVLPTITAPAERSRRATTASRRGTRSRNQAEPAVAGIPAKSMLSFSATGIPSSGPRLSPRARR